MKREARVVAESRQVDAWVGEACGHGVPDDLAERVLLRLREVPATRRINRLAVAAVLLGGVLAVVGVSLLHAPAVGVPAQEPQDPKPPTAQERVATVTMADLASPSVLHVDISNDRDVSKVVLGYAKDAGVPVVVPSDVVLTSNVGATVAGTPSGGVVASISRVGPKPWRVAVALLAAASGLAVREHGPVLTLVAGDDSLPYTAPLTLTMKDVDVVDFAKAIAGKVHVNLVVAGDAKGRVRCDLKAASWRDALDCVARQLDCVVDGYGSVLVLHRAAAAKVETHVAFKDTVVQEAIDKVALVTRLNVVVAPGLQGKVDGSVDNVAGPIVLTAVVAAVGGEVMQEGRGILRVVREGTVAARVDVAAESCDLPTVAQLVRSSAGIEVDVPRDAKERLAVFALGAPLRDVLRAAAMATGRRAVAHDQNKLNIE